VTTRAQNTPPPRTVILDAATALFSDTGYAGTTMRDIASVVGILPGSLYAHIASKEQLLLAIVEAGIDRFLGVVEPILLEDGATRDLLRRAVTRHIEVVAEDQQRTLVVFHQWRYLSPDNKGRIVAKRERYEQIFATLIGRGIADGTFDPALDERIAVLTVLGTLNWAAEWLSHDGDEARRIGEGMADILLRGLLRTPA
jgi:AcrR family transcriptional regulator